MPARLPKEDIQKLYDWLVDGRELKKLQELFAEIKANPRERSSRHWKVKNPDGTIYHRPKSKGADGSQRKSR